MLNSLPSESTDQDGDTVMGDMKIDIDTYTALIARINSGSHEAKSAYDLKPKLSAPSRTDKEAAEIREKNLYLRYKKGSHMAR